MDIALFSPSSLFADDDDDNSIGEEKEETLQSYVERKHTFPGMLSTLHGSDLCSWTESIVEVNCGTGALAIFLRKSFGVDITTSDFDDQEIEENIAHNCRVNGIMPILPHIRHSWGDTLPTTDPNWDLVIASDILLYVKQYPNLIKTLSFLLKSYKLNDNKAVPGRQDNQTGTDDMLPRPAFLMSWRRRIGKEDEAQFFNGCENAGFAVQHVGSRVYCISPRGNCNGTTGEVTTNLSPK
ncbi:hypothetical protein HHK36_010747 [Tetracentron sinense]|uniref:Uncharacterized protein n=1 Tax=Tetracentron sinense TaxID=13715 RepID=A0A835DGL2_TETSI|nr:hypothetical protein HHK36_010747 [Tetracentron sinense]